jgi:ABC-2 type transport system permease protein
MNKLWLVAANEFRRNVFKKSFIFALLSVPLIMAGSVGLGFLMNALMTNKAPVGYVDHAGVLDGAVAPPASRFQTPVSFIAFETEDEARAALEAEDVQAYYVLPPDYLSTSQVALFYLKEPGDNARSQFFEFMQINLLEGQPDDIALRIVQGSEISTRTADGSREFLASGPTLGQVLPVALSMAFVFLLLMNSSYMIEAVVEEKENRTIEVLATSVSMTQMIVGKIAGIIAVSLVLFLVWALVGVIAVAIAATAFDLRWFQNLSVEWGSLLAIVAVLLPSYVLSTALMVAAGSTVNSVQEGQSMTGIMSILYMIPLYTLVMIGEKPGGTFATVLTLLPFTSLMTLGARLLFYVVPLWQIIVAVVVQTLSAAGALWLASRAFRLGMLRYGQRLRLGEILARVSAAPAKPAAAQGGQP